MARPAGFEPATPSLEGSCSVQLSYGRVAAPIARFGQDRNSNSGRPAYGASGGREAEMDEVCAQTVDRGRGTPRRERCSARWTWTGCASARRRPQSGRGDRLPYRGRRRDHPRPHHLLRARPGRRFLEGRATSAVPARDDPYLAGPDARADSASAFATCAISSRCASTARALYDYHRGRPSSPRRLWKRRRRWCRTTALPWGRGARGRRHRCAAIRPATGCSVSEGVTMASGDRGRSRPARWPGGRCAISIS